FVSGYTAKVAGTEVGIREPQPTFSACFGKVFLPLHPTAYAELMGEKLKENPEVRVWLVNTGWTGGAYPEGKRISLQYTRAMVHAALQAIFALLSFIPHPYCGLLMPESCPDVPTGILDPRNTWEDKVAYDRQVQSPAELVIQNLDQYKAEVSEEIKHAAP